MIMQHEGRFNLKTDTITIASYSRELDSQTAFALAFWNRHLGRTVFRQASPNESADIKVGFTHDNPTGRWERDGTLAITSIPGPKWDGVLRFNPLEMDNTARFPLTVAHELGHALGYLHSVIPGNLMHPHADYASTALLPDEDRIARVVREDGIAPGMSFLEIALKAGANPYLIYGG